jgi:hypothetical protein
MIYFDERVETKNMGIYYLLLFIAWLTREIPWNIFPANQLKFWDSTAQKLDLGICNKKTCWI